MKHSFTPRSRKGFSLIEIMVAMTILVVIVLIVGGIFQQTSVAWVLGLQRAENQSNVRAVAGAMSRDLASMVDPGNLSVYASTKDAATQKTALETGLYSSVDKLVTGSSVKFWALRAPDMFDEDTKDTSRELVLIEYTAGGGTVDRKVTAYDKSSTSLGETESQGGAKSTFELSDGGVSFEAIDDTGSVTFTTPYGDKVAGVRIVVTPDKPVVSKNYEIYVGSCGPDGEKGTEDDIYPWGEGESK